MPITRQTSFPYTITIDSQPIRLRLKRMTGPEFAAFEARFIQVGERRGAPVLPDDPADITRTLLDAEVDHLRLNAEWQSDVFDRFVTAEPGQVFDEGEDGARREVTNGRELTDMFPGNDAFVDVIMRLYIEHKLTPEQKKRLQLRSGSDSGSNGEANPGTAGGKPAPTAASVANVPSAVDAGAMVDPSDTSSGTTVPSSSESVPCAT